MSLAARKQIAGQQRTQTRAQMYSVAAPVGGLNTRDALANMPETDAIIMDNWFPQPTWVEIREGNTTLGTFTGNCETLCAYSSLAAGTQQLFAAVNNAGTTFSIFRVDNLAGGAVGSPVVGGGGGTIESLSTATFDWAQFGTGAAEVLILLNGIDLPLIFDGTTWQKVTTFSAPYAWTGGPTPLSKLDQVAVYKQRVWCVEHGTFNVYYLPQNNFAGAFAVTNIGPNFKLGGYINNIITVSIDNAAGANDYIGFVSNVGEVVIFQGYDPANVPSAWSVAAHFRVGRPIGYGRRAWQKMASDAILISADGFVLMSEALLTDRSQTKNAVSAKIRRSVTEAVTLYGNNPGWQCILYPIGNKLIINVPTSTTLNASYCFVMNTLSGAWCTYGLLTSPLNAFCWENLGDNIYFGTDGSVQKADSGTSDNGAAISATIKPAFNYMGDKTRLKRWTQCQPIIQTTGTLTAAIILDVDFDVTGPTGAIPLSNSSSAVWNVSLWSTPTYWGDAVQVTKKWIGIVGVGYCATLQMQVSTATISISWQAVNYMFEPGGMFYGA